MHIILFFHSLWGREWLDNMMVLFAGYGLIFSLAAIVAAVIRRRPYRVLPSLLLGAVIAVGLDVLGGRLITDQRPFVALHVTPLLAHSADNGFPSDHSAVAAYVAAALWFIDAPAAALATAAALVLGVARVYVLVHWPIDVVGGWLIGALPAVIVMFIWRKQNG